MGHDKCTLNDISKCKFDNLICNFRERCECHLIKHDDICYSCNDKKKLEIKCKLCRMVEAYPNGTQEQKDFVNKTINNMRCKKRIGLDYDIEIHTGLNKNLLIY